MSISAYGALRLVRLWKHLTLLSSAPASDIWFRMGSTGTRVARIFGYSSSQCCVSDLRRAHLQRFVVYAFNATPARERIRRFRELPKPFCCETRPGLRQGN